MLHGHCSIVPVNDHLCGLADESLMDMARNQAIKAINDIAEAFIPVHRRASIDAAARTMRHGERIRRFWFILA